MKIRNYFSPILVLLLVLPLTSASAEVYSWEDRDGRVHYGTKPPKGSIRKKALAPKTYSTYSSKKLLKGYGINPDAPSKVQTPKTDSLPVTTKEIDIEVPKPAGPELTEPNSTEKTKDQVDNRSEQPKQSAANTEAEQSKKRSRLKPEVERPRVNPNPIVILNPEAKLQNNTSHNLLLEDQDLQLDQEGALVSGSFMIFNDSGQSIDGIEVTLSTGTRSYHTEGPSSVPNQTIGLFELSRNDLPIASSQLSRLTIRVSAKN